MSPDQDSRRVVGLGAADPERFRHGEARAALPRLDDEPTIAELVWTLIEGRWTVLTVAWAVFVLAIGYLVVATPTYHSNVLIQVEDKTKSVAGLEDLSTMFGDKTPAEAEMEIVRSRSLLGAVVDQLGLDIEVRPRRLPLLGAALARWHAGPGVSPAPLGLGRYAWGGERIRVTRLAVSDDLLDEPLILTALGEGRYRLRTGDGEALLEGVVGQAASGSAGERRAELFVSELVARPGTDLFVEKLRRADVIETLQEDLRIIEKGKKTGMVVISLNGADRAGIASILDAVSVTYLRQNVERKSAEAAKTLEFLESQLPILKANLDAAEAALNRFRLKKGTVDLSLETQAMLDRSVEVEKALTELEMQKSELHQSFTENHPMLASVAEKSAKLRNERAALQARLRTLPETELDSARLVRDVKVANELYFLLLNKAQELRVVKSGTIGNVRIIDHAIVPIRPVSPKKAVVLALSLLLGLGAGFAAVILRKSFAEGASDPEEIERGTGIPVYVTVPHSDKQADITREARRRAGVPAQILAGVDPGDVAVENLRSLRTSLQFALVESKNNVVAIGGPSPGVGKTFVCLNLAYVLAAADRRVLLVDADLRRGQLHRYFGLARRPGLSEALSGTALLSAVLRSTTVPGLDVLTSGETPPNPAEMLASNRFQQLVADLSRRYDLLILDTPPALAVTDPALIARCAGVNLLVLRAGQHPIREIALTVKRLGQSGIKIHGAVLNDVQSASGRYGRYGRYHRYEYRSDGRG